MRCRRGETCTVRLVSGTFLGGGGSAHGHLTVPEKQTLRHTRVLSRLPLAALALASCATPTDLGAPESTREESPPALPLPVEGRQSTSHWPMFRGPATSGVAASARPAIEWDLPTARNVRWTTEIGGYSHSSPVIWGDTVYVATSIGGDPTADGRRQGARNNAIDDLIEWDWKLLALRREDGRVVWERTAHRGAPRVRRDEKGSHANSTPATDGRYVVAVFNSEGLFCWTVDGELVWSRDLGRLDPGYWGQPDNNWGHATSPLLFEDLVIIQSDDFADSFVAAYRLSDGSEAWRVARDELATWATPVVHGEGDDAVLITQGGNHVRAYRARTGTELWSFADRAEVKVPSPFVVGRLLIFTGGAPAGRPIFAMELASTPAVSAATVAATPALRWTIRSGGPYTSTPIAYRNVLYVTRDNGVFGAYEIDTGALLYRQRVGGGFSASPVAADGRLYLSSEDGVVHVVGAGREFELLAENEIGEPLFATPAISGDLMVLRTPGRVVGVAEAPAAVSAALPVE